MNSLIYKLLKSLKEHVNQNNTEIQFNQKEIARLLADEANNSRKKDLDDMYLINRQLLGENSDFIKMQVELSEFFQKYKHLFPESSENEDSPQVEDDIFQQTINGTIQFDESHPEYNNPGFIEELLKFYEDRENYEMCEILLKLRNPS